ncbi:MAG: hypothetical protein PGN08_08515 [Sphingomonas taxi]
MLVLLLLIPSATSDTVANFRLAPPPPTLGCLSQSCTPAPREESYRIPNEADPLARTSKDRAFAADGQQCGLVGDKYCTSRGKTVFATDFSE